MENKKLLDEQKALLNKQLEEQKKTEQELAKNLELTRANINGILGALQYHDYLVNKLNNTATEPQVKAKEEATDTIFDEVTD